MTWISRINQTFRCFFSTTKNGGHNCEAHIIIIQQFYTCSAYTRSFSFQKLSVLKQEGFKWPCCDCRLRLNLDWPIWKNSREAEEVLLQISLLTKQSSVLLRFTTKSTSAIWSRISCRHKQSTERKKNNLSSTITIKKKLTTQTNSQRWQLKTSLSKIELYWF